MQEALTQIELEERMYTDGKDRAASMFARTEEKGRAAESPYAMRLYRQYVVPLADHIREELTNLGPGRHKAHVMLLKDLDPHSIAFLTVRATLGMMMGPKPGHHRNLAYHLGLSVHRELVLEQIADEAPELYHTLARDLHRRASKDDRHRVGVMRSKAIEHGIKFTEWRVGSRDQVGMWLLGKLEALGFIEIGEQRTSFVQGKARTGYRDVDLTPAVLADIDAVKTYIAETSPVYGPCVEPPREWHGLTGGGFHTPRMQRTNRYVVKFHPVARASVEACATDGAPWLRAVNHLQRTQWAVNPRILQVLDDLAAQGHEVAGVTLPVDPPRPERPEWMDRTDTKDMSEEERVMLLHWKTGMRKWYEARKLRVTEYSRFYTTTRQARMFLDRPLWLVWFLDSRGRAYPLATGLSPQGNDLQKGLLHFAEGKTLDTDKARFWFLVQGANKFGFDKAKLVDRAEWSTERRAAIRACAQDPLANRWWLEADKPLQFLAWCFEFDEWARTGSVASRIPISMDGSCNGLQHFSAMLRDEVGGEATNITANAVMQDIYRRVATEATVLMAADASDEFGYREWWLAKGIERDVVKRATMTTPYGVTKSTAGKYVVSDYLEPLKLPARGEWLRGCGAFVMKHVWAAIGKVVVKSRQAMDWLGLAAGRVVDRMGEDAHLHWATPDGFVATQAYFELELLRIKTLLHGEVRIRVTQESDKPARGKHKTALAPNFVHSMDGCHMRMVVLEAERRGIRDLAMIHDDYGTHAANADDLYHIIRETFHRMYTENDPLQQFKERYPFLSDPPTKGKLDLSEVLRSEFFFS